MYGRNSLTTKIGYQSLWSYILRQKHLARMMNTCASATFQETVVASLAELTNCVIDVRSTTTAADGAAIVAFVGPEIAAMLVAKSR